MELKRSLREPVILVKENPEHFNFVVSVLKGEI